MSNNDGDIELVEIESITSPRSSISRLKSRNKVGSSPYSSPTYESGKNFQLPPVKPPRLNLRKKSLDATESGFSSKSDTRSYKERLKERFESIRDKAEKSAIRHHSTLRENLDLVQKESADADAEYKNYERSQIQEEWQFSQMEKHDFFCLETKDDANEEVVPQHEAETNQSTDNLYDDSTDEKLVEMLRPQDVNFSLQLAANDHLWYPSSQRIAITHKEREEFEGEDENPVISEPKVCTRHLNQIKQRLLNESSSKWFDSKGRLKTLPNPYRKQSFRPKKPDIKIYLEFQKPISKDDAELDEVLVMKEQTIELYINSIYFRHHHLFSVEHMFQEQLKELFDSYKNSDKQVLETRLDEARQFRNNLLDMADVREDEVKQSHENVRKERNELFKEGANNRRVIKEILATWKIIKSIREHNGYSNTSIRLIIHKEKRKYHEERKQKESSIQTIVSEIIQEEHFEYQRRLNDYKNRLQVWKATLDHKKPKKPIKDIDKSIIRHEVEQTFEESCKAPGEPTLNFEITYDNEITSLEAIRNNEETLRRNAVNSTKIHLKILCNGMEVCKSKTVNLDDSFRCILDEAISIRMIQVPEKIVLELYEHSKSKNHHKPIEIELLLPTTTKAKPSYQDEEKTFEKDETITHKHAGIGSDIKLISLCEKHNWDYPENVRDTHLYTNGKVAYHIEWNKDSETEKENESVHYLIANDDGTINMGKLMKWVAEHKPDPADPKHAILYEYIKSYIEDPDEESNAKKTYFRCNPGMERFEFCDRVKLEENPRFQLLRLRDENEPEFIGMTVPNRIKEIPATLLNDYKRRIHTMEESNSDEESQDEEIDKRRSKGRKQIKIIYSRAFQMCQCAENHLIYEDIVNEKIIEDIITFLWSCISKIMEWIQFRSLRRPIKETYAIKKVRFPPTDFNSTLHVVVHVVSAINIPPRNDSFEIKSSKSQKSGTDSMEPRPFIEIHYLKEFAKTTVEEGCNPVWEEELIISLNSQATNYLNPNALNGAIRIHLFDEISTENEFHPNGQNNWLGFIEIPVSAIQEKMEGTFKLTKPIMLFGYEQETLTDSSRNSQNIYLTLSIAIKPKIPKITPSMEEYASNELPQIRNHLLQWNETFNLNYPQRKCTIFALDSNRKTTCVTRYLKPLEPPIFDGVDTTPELLMRYVSMIPFNNANKFYQNIWLTTEQVIKYVTGSVVDHVVALTCFFLAMDMEAWLVFGKGLPNGASAYVLTREYRDDSPIPLHFIYDVVSNSKYNVMDPLCPLIHVFYVANSTNLWGNTQRTQHLNLTNFDLTRRGDWLPLFNNTITAPSTTIQPKLTHSTTPDVRLLEKRLEKKIRKWMAKLRKYTKTSWNPYVSSTLRSALVKFDSIKTQSRTIADLIKDLQTYGFGSTHALNGYIINLPYVNVRQIIEQVAATGIHFRSGINTEFASAVHVCAYLNHVLVVWIALGVVTIKN